MTCLHWAAGRGHTEVVDLLLNNGAKVDATDKVRFLFLCTGQPVLYHAKYMY